MRIVAIRTRDPAGRDRMGGEIVHLRALRFVTGKADLTLRFLGKHFVLRLMNLVARRTRHIIAGMRATRPMRAFAGRMTIETRAALHLGRRFIRAAEHKIRHGPRDGFIRMPHMRTAGAVTRLAPRLSGHAVTGAMNRQDRFFFIRAMTARADRVAAGAFFENEWRIGRVYRYERQHAECNRRRCHHNDQGFSDQFFHVLESRLGSLVDRFNRVLFGA